MPIPSLHLQKFHTQWEQVYLQMRSGRSNYILIIMCSHLVLKCVFSYLNNLSGYRPHFNTRCKWGFRVHSLAFWVPYILFSWQRMMRDLEEKEKELNKLKVKADGLLSNNHPASDKIQVRILLFCCCFFPVINSKFSGSVLMSLCVCVPPGLHGHLADPVELASPDH